MQPMPFPLCPALSPLSLPEAENADKVVQPTPPDAPCPGEGRWFEWASQESAAL